MKTIAPAAFLSYVHDDNATLDGRIHYFADHLAKMVRLVTGETFPIWLDRKDLQWGQAWKERIEAGLESATFFIPVITPSYFRSKACREEFDFFAKLAAARGRNDLILPLYLIQVDGLHDEHFRETDPLARLVLQHQYADWREYALESREMLHKPCHALATQIKLAIGRLQAPPAAPKPAAATAGAASAGAAASAPTARTEPRTFVVDPMHRGDFTSIGEAIRKAPAGARILVRPGTYQEALVINKPLEIIGDGPRESIEVETSGADVILFKTTMGRVANLTLRQRGGGSWYGVDIAQGRLDLENCDIQSDSLACVAVHDGAAPRVVGNRIHHGKQGGIYIYENGRGTIEQNEIFGNTTSGVAIKTGGDPVIRNNKIHDGKQNGLMIYENGRGTIEQNEIFENTFAGIEIKTGGDPIIRSNKIHYGKQGGVLVGENGRGTIEQNEIFENTFAGIEIRTGGNPIVRSNHIHHGKQPGILVDKNGLGQIEQNDIFDNSGSGIIVRSGGNPTVYKNHIYQNGYEAIYIYDGGRGTFENNTLRDNKKGPWDIAADCLPHIKRSGNIEA